MENILEIKKIHKAFGGVKALNNCSLNVKPGIITALIGPNGSGKTTLFDVISQLVDEDSGEIKFNQKTISDLKPHQVSKEGISRTFQDPRLFRNMTVKDHIEIALYQNDEKLIKMLFGSKEKYDQKIREVLGLVGFNKPQSTLGSDLSYGQRKLLDLAIAIAKPHKLLMLDEPVAGVNPKLREEIKKILKTLLRKNETILVIEHDMNFIAEIADYIFVIDEGRIIVEGEPKKVLNNKKVLEAYLGE